MKYNFLKSNKNSFLKVCFKATLLFVLILSVITTSLSFVYDSKYKAGNTIFAPTIVYTFAGAGTSSNPYQINNSTDLRNLATNVNNGTTYAGKYFKVTTNINLNNVSFTPIGNTSLRYFSGTFDGGNHIIDGLNVTITTAYAGLFGCVNGATIKNIIVNGVIDVCCVTGSSHAGGIVGYARGSSTFYNCANWATVRNTGNRYTVSAGGIVGYVSYSSTKFTLCKNLGNIYAGSYKTSNYYHYHYAGGILGYGEPTITKCFNSGTVSAGGSYSQSAYAAGIVGKGSATISYCYNTGSVSAYAKEITTTYYFNLLGIYKVGENGTKYTRFDLTSNASSIEKLNYEVVVGDDYDRFGGYSNSIVYGKTTLDAYTNYIEPTDDKNYFSEYTDKSWQKKYVITKDAYASGISNYGNLNNCYNIGTISSGGYYDVQWIFNLKCRYVFFITDKSSEEQIFEFNFQTTRSAAITLNGTASSNCYYSNNTTYNICSYRINSGHYNNLYYGKSHSYEHSVDVGGKQTHYFSIEKAADSDDIYFYIQNEKKNGIKGNIFSHCSAGNINVFNKNPYITYENKASVRGTKSSNIKTVFNGDSVWATNSAINNGYPYIKEMYWQ